MKSQWSSPNENDSFLAQWIAGDISDDQLLEMVSDADYQAYAQLRGSLASMQLSEPDLDENFAAIQNKIQQPKAVVSRSKVISLYASIAVAASVLLFFGWNAVFSFSKHFESPYASTQTLALNDDSQVILNAHSSIDYPKWFSLNRQLKLNGEAFFKVSKGSKFTVETPMGNVQVLGTQFNVLTGKDFLEVSCFEGKVCVTHLGQEWILTPGMDVRINGNEVQTWNQNIAKQPAWISGESSFTNMPLHMVIQQLEKQYHCTINFPPSLAQIKYTGSFPHHSLETALQSVCLPLHLKHRIISEGNIEISE
ncbi:FecR domain-containing protein [Flavobacterium sp. CYK-55]|uniref:FecR family protein n=1 Tax=Flavobacterium sp. CYK-55 TaxID=2835529 RepID=UPI001BD1B80F|nr:FecR domain-containing protein [Flavobacterium sp. CYK-55]MBS7786995.1 FecR domain-containing protein [Flavobacterium sp. CYK-55]